MYRTDLKAIFLIGLIFSIATLTGPVSAVNSNITPESDFYSVTSIHTVNYAIFQTNTSLINLAKKDKDYYFKKHKKGIENLQSISTSGIPPKGPGEIIMYNLPKMLSMIKTVKTKITHTFQTFYKKNLK